MQKITGIICIVVGVLLLVWGHNIARSIGGQFHSFVSGSPGDKPMWLYTGGIVLLVLGVAQVLWPSRR